MFFMPQMKPMNWLLLYFLFSISMMIMFTINYHNKMNIKLLNLKKNKKKKNWTW